ncbi:MAG: hypothetical protein RMY29_014505 [Nostoc sp. CreGUA01]
MNQSIIADWLTGFYCHQTSPPIMNITQQKDVLLSNDFLSYLVVAYALISEDLAKHTGEPSIVHRMKYFDQGKQKFHSFSPEKLQQFLNEYYPT